jgi:hypothetical protein
MTKLIIKLQAREIVQTSDWQLVLKRPIPLKQTRSSGKNLCPFFHQITVTVINVNHLVHKLLRGGTQTDRTLKDRQTDRHKVK